MLTVTRAGCTGTIRRGIFKFAARLRRNIRVGALPDHAAPVTAPHLPNQSRSQLPQAPGPARATGHGDPPGGAQPEAARHRGMQR